MPVGVVLAGGRSSRFGSDKAAVELDGSTLLEIAVSLLEAVCGEVVVAGSERSSIAPFELVGDGPGRGPAAGILGASRAFGDRSVLVLACDMPLVSTELLATLLGGRDHDWHLPRHAGGIEPLCAHYGRQALLALEEQVAAGDFALQSLVDSSLRTRFLEGAELQELGDPRRIFLNVNTPEDLAALLEDRG